MVVVEELGILLEADPTGLEEGLEKATQKTKEFEEQTEKSSLKMLEAIAKQEAMVSSLNQVAGRTYKEILDRLDMLIAAVRESGGDIVLDGKKVGKQIANTSTSPVRG